jgi:allene oxide cyclase
MAKVLWAAGAVSVFAATAFAVGAASASSGVVTPVRITVVEHATTDTVVDVGKKGDSTGDILTFHNRLYDATDTNRVGADQGQCVRESPKAGTWECWWTASLPHGQITIEGPFLDSTNSVLAAVTGGTGLYSNARGSMKATCSGNECVLRYRVIP